jgi:prepilin-type N-terminal cleavage/methylation domain-containing protein
MRPPSEKVSAGRRAFTLLELLITLTILGLVLAAVYGALVKTLEVREIIEAETTGPREGLALLELMARDFRGAVLPEPLGSENAPFHGKAARNSDGKDADQVVFIASVTSRFAQDARKLRGEEIAGLGDEDPDDPESREVRADICEVSYLLKDDPDHPGRMHLFRREDFHVDSNPRKGGAYLRLHSRVRGLRLRYYTGDEGTTGRDPEENWKASEAKALPVAVEITLTLEVNRAEGEAETDVVEPTRATFRTVVPIMAGRMGGADEEDEEEGVGGGEPDPGDDGGENG